MDMMAFLFERLFFFDLLLVGFIATAKFPKRSRFPLRVAGAVLFCVAASCVWAVLFSGRLGGSLALMVLASFSAFLIVMAAICFCIWLDGWKALYMGTSIWFAQHITNCVEQFLHRKFAMTPAYLLIHTGIVLLVTLAVYLVFFRKLRYDILDRVDLKAIAPIWCIMCLMCVVVNTHAALTGETSTSFYLADLLCNLAGLLYQSSVYRFYGLKREKDGVQKLLEESEAQYEAAKRNTELINIKCHDLRHMIRHFQRQGRVDEGVFAEMEQAVREYDSAIKTGNPALDVILTEKSARCAALGIGFTCMADAAGLDYVKPVDLYVLFGNALENAIEAAQRLREPEKKQISLTARRVEGFYSVHLQNYTDNTLQFVDDMPLTGKEDKQNHGFGLKSMRLLAEKYDGELHIRQTGDVVELYLLLPAKEKTQQAS